MCLSDRQINSARVKPPAIQKNTSLERGGKTRKESAKSNTGGNTLNCHKIKKS